MRVNFDDFPKEPKVHKMYCKLNSEFRSQNSGVRIQESEFRSQNSGVRPLETGGWKLEWVSIFDFQIFIIHYSLFIPFLPEDPE